MTYILLDKSAVLLLLLCDSCKNAVRFMKYYNTENKLIKLTIIKSCNKISIFKITLHYTILLFTQPVLFFETHKKVSNKLNIPIIYCTLKK
jgi:hypothetical protein